MSSSKYDQYNYEPIYTQADADSWIHLHEEQRDEISKLREELKICRAQQENRPLTLDELRQMDGEPVWIQTIGLVGSVNGYGIVGTRAAITQDFCTTALWYKDYGDTWLAYRSKPKEEMK